MAEYYQFRDIVTRFDVFEDGEDVTPFQALVLIYDPDGKYLCKDTAGILGSEVRYVLGSEYVEKTGEYIFVFDIGIRNLGNYTHVVKVDVESLPVSGEVLNAN